MSRTYSEIVMQLHNLVKDLIKHKAPALHKEMAGKGTLTAFVKDAAEEIASNVVTMTQALRAREQWDKLGPMESAKRIRSADLMHQEQALSQWAEALPAETSPQNLD
jgi:hypothetical protein